MGQYHAIHDNYEIEINAPISPIHSTGLVERDFQSHPQGYLGAYAPAFPSDLLIPQDQWAGLLASNRANKCGLLDLREAHYDTLKSLDQDGLGLCWAFSSTKAAMYTRARMGAPPVILSAWWVAGEIKGWRDEGGWGAASLQKIATDGIPLMSLCPAYKSSYDNADCKASAAQHKFTQWFDGAEDSSTAHAQLVSCLLRGIPCVVDLNVMGHSMCAIDLLDVNTIIYDNSWGEQGDKKGLYYGKGQYAMPNGLVIPTLSNPSMT